MRYFIRLAIFMLLPYVSYGQKQPIDASIYDKWPVIDFGSVKISNNGLFMTYYVNYPADNFGKFIIRATKRNWQKNFSNVGSIVGFSADSKRLIYQSIGDSLVFIKPGTDSASYVPHVKLCSFMSDGRTELLIYLRDDRQQLNILNIANNEQEVIDNVVSFEPDQSKKSLIIQTHEKGADLNDIVYKWLVLADKSVFAFYKGRAISDMLVDWPNQQLVFAKESTAGKQALYYRIGMKEAELLIGEYTSPSKPGFNLDRLVGFVDDGKKLIMGYKRVNSLPQKKYDVPVNVWSYTDATLQPEQLRKTKDTIDEIQMSWSLKEKVLEPSMGMPGNTVNRGAEGPAQEKLWNKKSSDSVCVITSTGKSVFLDKHDLQNISAGKKYIVYYDLKDKNFFSYEITSGVKRNLTHAIHTRWDGIGPDLSQSNFHWHLVLDPPAWDINEQWVLLYDRYDIWQIDPSGQTPPINLTNGYGAKHHITFRLATSLNYDYLNHITLSSTGKLLLSAFNHDTKENGFYRIIIGKQVDPEKLTMGPYTYFAPQKLGTSLDAKGTAPVKAKSKEAYVVFRQSAKDYPNLFYTEDFKAFEPLTTLAPQKNYNWLTTELLSWKTPDGIQTLGILYKPEDFNSAKKYPVIFNIYELRSDDLNTFKMPEAAKSSINIEWYVSHGYLVFEPDMYYLKDKPFESGLHTINSAVRLLKKMPFVDSSRLGLIGHSWGSMQVNYIVTHSNLFAAVCSASGIADFISLSGSLFKTQAYSGWPVYTLDPQPMQMRAPGNLWDHQQWYLRNSPVLQADKITSPLLMMHTTKDGICPIENAIEFFTALRKLGKKSWLLEYEDGTHSLHGKSALDYDKRLQQFFGYYLKGELPPKWMVEGVPAKLKGVDSGLEVEAKGVNPGSGISKIIINKSKKHKNETN